MKILKPLGEIFRFSLHDGFHTAAMQTTTPTPWGRSEALLAVIVTALFSLLVWTTVFGGAQFGPIRELLRSIPASDKVGHFAIYGSIAFFAALLVKQPSRIHVAAVVIGAISFAEEYRQSQTLDVPTASRISSRTGLGSWLPCGWRRPSCGDANQRFQRLRRVEKSVKTEPPSCADNGSHLRASAAARSRAKRVSSNPTDGLYVSVSTTGT